MAVVDFKKREWQQIVFAIQRCRYFVEWQDSIANQLNVKSSNVRVEPSDPFALDEDGDCLYLVVMPMQHSWRMARLSYVTIVGLKKELRGTTKYTVYLIDQLEIGHPIDRHLAKFGYQHHPMALREFQAKYAI